MRYCIAMELTRRYAVFFDADDDASAEEKAAQINEETTDENFASGGTERDYALFNQDTGQTILDWD